ncbi:MAG TPA: hypothetical protein VK176_12030 [Phycisphaerales bacterium]|nr:hypothetical protein [Phycisphaerales bacterium]
MRDPLYRKITERLRGDVEPAAFERCAQDLLQQAYSTLSPVVGGKDGGFDGAVGTEDGPFPLICTVSADVTANVRKSLATYRAKGTGPRRAVVATSRTLSPPAQMKILELGRELGVTIVGIYEAAWFAQALYHNARWRLDLLGLTGNPPALSVFPLNARPWSDVPLTGRADALERIRAHAGDLLVVGVPGSGKTYLYQKLALEGGCLFVTSSDRTQIANDVREFEPRCVVIDDAHVAIESVRQMVQLRRELGAKLTIHANCWPGHDAAVADAMGLSASSLVHLDLLGRDVMVELIKACGVHGPDQLITFLLNQAEGKPGLAVALVEACKRGEMVRVWSGETLANILLAGRELAKSQRERAVLASFAVGGDWGVSLQRVASALSLPAVEIRDIVTNVGAGGIVGPVGMDAVAVYPEILRAALVKEVFFSGMAPLPPDEIIAACQSKEQVAHVLLHVRQRGGKVDFERIRTLVPRDSQPELWNHLAAADEQCARFVLEQQDRTVIGAAHHLLDVLPDATLDRLLRTSLAKTIGSNDWYPQAHRTVREWMSDDVEETIDKRKQLLRATERITKSHGASADVVVGWAAAQAMHPGYERHHQVAGVGNKFACDHGILPIDELRQIAGLWPAAIALIPPNVSRAWRPLMQIVGYWCVPQYIDRAIAAKPEVAEFMKSQSAGMLRDVTTLAGSHRAMRAWAVRLADQASLAAPCTSDEDFDAIFGEHPIREDWNEGQKRIDRERVELAARLATRPIGETVEYLQELELEADAVFDVARGGSRWWFYRMLAGKVVDAGEWAKAMISREMRPDFVAPMLSRMVGDRREDAEKLLEALLTNPTYHATAIAAALALDPPAAVTANSAAALPASGGWDAYRLHSVGIPLVTMERLLTHADRSIRVAAAFSLWLQSPEHEIPPSCRLTWEKGVVEARPEDGEYELGEILKANPSLAYEWAKVTLSDASSIAFGAGHDILCEAVRTLDVAHRKRLMTLLEYSRWSEAFFDALIGEDAALAHQWFETFSESRMREAPLRRGPSDRWAWTAVIALEHRFTAQELAVLCEPMMGCIHGNGVDDAQSLQGAYRKLLSHPDSRLHLAGQKGVEQTEIMLKRCRELEQAEQVYGFRSGRRLAMTAQF